MTFLCNTKIRPLQPEITYTFMETIYLCIIIFLFVLAVFDLMVGVSNDAVNFLNSAVGARRHLLKQYCSLQVPVSSSERPYQTV